MRIGLFALETGRDVGGLEVYETQLIRALAEVDEQNSYIVFCLDPAVPEILNVRSRNFEFCVLPTNRFKGVLWDAPRAMARAHLDLFHAIFVPPPFTGIPYVFTYNGTEVIERPDFYPWALGLRIRFLYRRAFKKAKQIICVSDFVQESLATKEGIERERLRTIYYGCAPEFQKIDRATALKTVETRYSLSTPYAITVGRIEPRKNPIRVLRAYDRFRQCVPNAPKLVFAGMKTWSAMEFDQTIQELGLEDHIVELGHVPHDELPALYAASEFVIFASLWEGFGLPALEALTAGTPLIASHNTSLREVFGECSLMIDPESIDELSAAMRSLYLDRNLREELVLKGRKKAAEFNWKRTATETLEVYREVASRSR